jgi:hypothetical protein
VGLCRRATANRDMTKSVGDRLSEGLGTIRADTRHAGPGPSPPAAHILPEQRRFDARPPPLLIKLGCLHNEAFDDRVGEFERADAEVISQKIKAPRDRPDKGLVGVFLKLQRRQGRIDRADGGPLVGLSAMSQSPLLGPSESPLSSTPTWWRGRTITIARQNLPLSPGCGVCSGARRSQGRGLRPRRDAAGPMGRSLSATIARASISPGA